MVKRALKNRKKPRPAKFLKGAQAQPVNYDQKPPVFSFEKMVDNPGTR